MAFMASLSLKIHGFRIQKEIWLKQTSEIHSVEITPFAATWMDLEIITLSKESQKEKDKYPVISVICGI